MNRSKLTISVVVGAIFFLAICVAGTAVATPNAPTDGIESPATGVEDDRNITQNSTVSAQNVSSGNIEVANTGDVPPSTLIGSFGGKYENENIAINDMVLTDGGNYIVVGSVSNSTTSKGFVSKISSSGSVIWSHRYGNNGEQALWSGIQTQSGDYVLAGWTETTDSYTGWGVKIDEDGEKLWEFAPSGISEGIYSDVVETTDQEYLFAGSYTSSEGDYQAWVSKTTYSGELLWDFIYWHESEQNYQLFNEIEQIETDRYVAVGAEFQDDNWDAWALEIDSDGEVLSSDTHGHSILSDAFTDVTVTDGGDPIYIGSRNGNWDGENNRYISLDAWIYYDSPNGQWSETVSSETVNRFSAGDVADDRMVAVGHTSSEDGIERHKMTAEFDLGGSQNWVSISGDGIDQDLDAVVAKGSETYVAGEKQPTENDNYIGTLSKYNSEGTGESGVIDYTNEEKIVDTDGLRDAIDDWRSKEIETDLLREVINAWRSGEQVG